MSWQWRMVSAPLVFMCILTFIHSNRVAAGYQSWAVSYRGEDLAGCGTSHVDLSSCRTLEYVLAMAEDGDLIQVETGTAYSTVFELTTGNGDHSILSKGLRILGVNGKPRILLTGDNDKGGGRGKQPTGDNCELIIENVILEKGLISFGGCSVKLVDVKFIDAGVTETDDQQNVKLYIEGCDFYGEPVCRPDGQCSRLRESRMNCNTINLTIIGSSFHNTGFGVTTGTGETSLITIVNSQFDNRDNQPRVNGGFYVHLNTQKSNVTVVNCTFAHLFHPTMLQSAMNNNEAALLVDSGTSSSASFLRVKDCVFYNNERGFNAYGTWKNITLANCTFEKNVATHAGAGILMQALDSHLTVQGCRFISNRAGALRSRDYHDTPGTVHVVNDSEIHIDIDGNKDVFTMDGNGGAIRAELGEVNVINCTFTNNTALLQGGSIEINDKADVGIYDSRFENSPDLVLAEQGDIIHSRGTVILSGVVFDVRSASNTVSLVEHHGSDSLMDVSQISFLCPAGFDVRGSNSTTDRKVDNLVYSCQSCPQNQYSHDRGYLNYTLNSKTDGSSPNSMTEGGSKLHLINCKECPYWGCPSGATFVVNSMFLLFTGLFLSHLF